jgi:Xaa-Pro dipeptidase
MMPLGEAFYKRKVEQIQARLEQENLDGLLLLDVYNVVYTSGFLHSPSERPLGFYIPRTGSSTLFVPLLEQENAADTWVEDIRTYFEYPGEEHPVCWMVRETGVSRLGVDNLSHTLFKSLHDAVVITSLVDEMRWVKDPEEIALIEQAATYADFCLQQVRDHAGAIISGGGTEVDILAMCISATQEKMQRELDGKFSKRSLGVVGTVHSGPRAALPHGEPITRKPQLGDTIIAGIGARVGGYHAESGATFLVGEPTADRMMCLEAAERCSLAAIETLKPGVMCAEVNAAALRVLDESELGNAIRHRIGHGMGLQGHESPWLAPGDRTLLVPNMVFSNEPGIYRPGNDGYRTINTMIVTEDTAKVPSRFLTENPPEKRILSL